jgi:cystathionine beta-synthase
VEGENMMKGAKKNVLEAIGNTPIVKLNKVASHVKSEIYVKLEYTNPGGSIKERIGSYILDKAVKEGLLKPGGTIIEATSGNTGVGLAMFAAVYGYKCIFVMADKQSQEKVNNLKAYGARVVICPTNVAPEDPRSYYSVAKRLSETVPNSYYVNQYSNLWNSETHYKTTGPEIYNQTGGEFDVFMATAGTGGTITGISKFLKEKMPKLTTVGIDCEGSILAHFAKTGEMIEGKSYVIEGMGEDFIPENYDFKLIDDWVVIGDKESFQMTRRLLEEEGIYTGGSGGGAVVGAIKYAQTLKEPKRILIILPDSGNRYTSKIYNDAWMAKNNYSELKINPSLNEIISTLNKKTPSFDDGEIVLNALKKMEEKNLTMAPLTSKGAFKGIVSQKGLLNKLLEGSLFLNDPLTLACENTFTSLSGNLKLKDVGNDLLQNTQGFLVTNEQENTLNVLTNSDVLNFFGKV